MSKYKKVSTSLDFVAREEATAKFWKENKIFESTMNVGEGNFTFYDGPPTANGNPHIGHVLTRSIKDLLPRYQFMKGKKVLRKAGWDTHGLPVELEVEKLLGIDGKKQIEEYGIDKFNEQCKQSVWKYQTEWEQLSDRVAYWADMEDPYVTYDNNYIESEWWALRTISDKGLLYKGHKIVPYCPRCGTALSSHEVAQGYKDVTDTTAVVAFELVNTPNTYFLAWTTTPWTLPSNVALCMHSDYDYVTVEHDGKYFILAQELVAKHFSEDSYTVVACNKGKHFEHMAYKPLFDYADTKGGCFVTNADFVTLTDGTGIVHIAPAYGNDDSEVGKKYNLPFVQLVGEAGKFADNCGELAGVFCKKADAMIIDMLTKSGNLFSTAPHMHSYPHCWRCDTPLIYYARQSWFVKMSAVKDDLLRVNNSINWMPPTIGSGRMGNFLENVIDWGISRNRYWGTPLPVWVCDKCGKSHVIGSRQELHDLSGCGTDIELHRPYIDGVHWGCECGGTMTRELDVIDCWFDSGSMPYAQFHYPFENKGLFEQNFPAQFISEAVDQTRGWFYTLIAISTLLFDKAPFENCIVLGHVGDKHGIKMSKHKGNGVDPWDCFNSQGADAVRWYFYTASAPWLPSRFSHEAISESQRKFLGTLWNTYAFFVLYADIDSFDPSQYSLADCKLSLMDRWLVSELNQLVDTVDKGLANYEIQDPARAIEKFVDNLSNWYIRRSRERYWGSEWTADKQSAYVTLHHTLVTLAKISAPFVPFVSEEIYQNLVVNFYADAPKSVHLCSFPTVDSSAVDSKLNSDMQLVVDIVVLGRSARNSSNIKNRQPLSKLYVMTDKVVDDDMSDIICQELNVKSLEVTTTIDQFAGYEIKPQLRTMGPKYGKILSSIRDYFTAMSFDMAKELVATVNNGGQYSMNVGGNEVVVSSQDVLISSTNKSGYCVASDNGISVVLDTEITAELVAEGIMRELVSKIQTMRKECDFVVTDHINICYNGSKEVVAVVDMYHDDILADTLADSIVLSSDNLDKSWDINGNTVQLTLTKVC